MITKRAMKLALSLSFLVGSATANMKDALEVDAFALEGNLPEDELFFGRNLGGAIISMSMAPTPAVSCMMQVLLYSR